MVRALQQPLTPRQGSLKPGRVFQNPVLTAQNVGCWAPWLLAQGVCDTTDRGELSCLLSSRRLNCPPVPVPGPLLLGKHTDDQGLLTELGQGWETRAKGPLHNPKA